MQYPSPIANAASQTHTISVSASYSSPSASPPSFFPSWCLFFIWSDDSTNTVSWRLLLSHRSSDSTYKNFNIFFIVLHSMNHSLQRYVCFSVFILKVFAFRCSTAAALQRKRRQRDIFANAGVNKKGQHFSFLHL